MSDDMEKSLLGRTGRQLLSLAILFSLVYNVSFLALPQATLGRLAILYLLWEQRDVVIGKFRILILRHPYVLLIFAGVLIHAAIGYFAGGLEDSTQMSRQFHFLVYSVLGSYLYVIHLRGDFTAFLRNFAIVTAFQGALIVFSLISTEYRIWLADLLVQGSNHPLTLATRPPGFSNSGGANLSVIQSLGVFCCFYMALNATSRWGRLLASIGVIITVLSTVLTGRTGLVLSGIFAAVFCARELARFRFLPTAIVCVSLFALYTQGPLLIDFLMENRGNSLPDFQRISNWAFEFFLNEGDVYSVYDLQTMPIPELSFETIIGTGIVENGSGNDSGYIQNYYALGLIMAIVFYGAVLYLCVRMLNVSREKILALTLVAGIFFIEIKEPFILKYIYVFFIMALYYLRSRLASDSDEART